jgi:hypothetical protein
MGSSFPCACTAAAEKKQETGQVQTAAALPDRYMLQDTDPSSDKWEGTGLYSIERSCLKAVFPFPNRKDATKDAVGYNNFSVQGAGRSSS